MSYPEVLLWQRLRGSPMGVRFRKGHPVGSDYVADFHCAAAKLVIEIDGEIHAHSLERDAVRNRYMEDHGLRVIRIPAADVVRNVDGIAAALVALVTAAPHHPVDGPPPRAGEDRRN